jgi:hypothetical protein
MRSVYRLRCCFGQRQLIEPETFNSERIQERFKIASDNYEFVIVNKPPASRLIYTHHADTPAALLKKNAIHILPLSLPPLNKQEKLSAVSKQLEQTYDNAFRGCRSGKEIFHL